MEYMFADCPLLTSLDISNFDFVNYVNLNHFFYNCINLEYINFGKNNIRNYLYSIFWNVPDNIVVCTNSINIIKELNKTKTCYTIDCSGNWKLNKKKIINGTRLCIGSCANNTEFEFEYNDKCYKDCPNGNYTDNDFPSIKKCKCELEKCLSCPNVPLSKNLCTKCNNGYYPVENDPLNVGEYINCYKELKGYYLDKNDLLYKKCYYTCDTCEKNGDNFTHNCLTCNGNYSFQIIFNNYFNCYKNCNYYYYFDNEFIYH